MRILDGINVVALEQAVAAPFASRQLADLGARVIKVERPGIGDPARHYDDTVNGLSSYFVWLNRSKESLTLDLKQLEAVQLLRQLLESADVFLHNLAPGAVDRLGLDSARLREACPRLIICAISGYGRAGPFATRKAYDLLVQAEAGLVSITGTEGEPCKVSIPIADIAAGMYAFSGILAALLGRSRTGQGTVIEVALLDAIGEWMSQPLHYTTGGGAPPARMGARHATIAPYGPFRCSDGRTVFLATQNAEEWTSFCARVLRRPELATDERFATIPLRARNRAALEQTIDEVMRELPSDEVLARLEDARIANARMRSVAEFASHPQLAARDRWTDVHSPVGPIRALRSPFEIPEYDTVTGAVPALGEHTEPILRALGLATAEIDALRRKGAV